VITLAAACWMLALANPLTLWDVGFQLSAMATAGLILFTPMLASAAARLWPGWMGGALTSPYASPSATAPRQSPEIVRGLFEDSVVVSLAATIAVAPLIAYTFGRVSVTGILANLLIVPAQPLITVWGSAGALAGALGATMPAQLLLWIAWPGLFWTVEVVERAASLPFASIEIANYGLTAMLATYVAMATLLWRKPIVNFFASLTRANRYDVGGALQRPVTLIATGLVMILVWWAYLVQPDGRLHLYFLDVGQGDAIFIQTPSGRQVLIDGGSSPQALSDELGAVMPFWDRSLDMVILTHADSDHMDAQTQVMERFDVERAISTHHTLESPDSAGWRAAVARKDLPVDSQYAGGWIDLGDGVALWTLSPAAEEYIGPDPENATSLVLKLVYGDFSALLTADAGLVSEYEWLANDAPLRATVLKAGHHGSRTSTSAPFVAAVDPQVAVIQVGAGNRYGHPHTEVLDNLAGRLVLRNDVDGRIHFVCDGREARYETETNSSVGRISLRQITPPP
jgi:competence protein ComEC